MSAVATKDYSIPYASTVSSIEEVGISGDWLTSASTRQASFKEPFYYRSLLSLFEIDSSSVCPDFVPMSETYMTEPLSEEDIINEMLEHDFIVRMPPRRRYTIELEIKSIKKAEPKIVEPEWI
jgi:hypothetical protein